MMALGKHGAVLATAFLLVGTTVAAQEGSAQSLQAPISEASVPDQFQTAQLVWSTLIALDHANRTGNYSVLRDLGSPTFREANSPARLADIFRQLRQEDLGLRRAILLVPVYDEVPTINGNGRLRMVGRFATRPVGLRFDLEFEAQNGFWYVYNIAIAPYQPMESNAAGFGENAQDN